MGKEPRAPRIGELDALRGLAAFAVMVFHYTSLYGQNIGHLIAPSFGFPPGNYGVQLFFMISGFVIFMTIERTRTAMDFVVSRFSRLFPAYWAAITISAAFVYTIGLPDQQLPLGELLGNLTMVQSIMHMNHLDGSYWTLQVELFFYIQILLWFLSGQLERIHWIIGLWLVTALVFAISEQHYHNISWTLRELLILQHIPFFAMGILFYKLYTRRGSQVLAHAMIAACIAVIAITKEPVYLSVALVCTAVFYLFTFGALGWLAARPFAFLGTISYSLYLLHQVIGVDIIWHLERDAHVSGNVAVLIAIAISIGLATLLTKLVEQPAMRAIRRVWKNRRQPMPQTDAPPT